MKRLIYGAAPVVIVFFLSACAGPRVISGFGELRDGEGNPRSAPHSGVDVWGNPGDQVLAGASGRVVVAADEPSGLSYATCGKYLVLEHDVANVLIAPRTTYCHLSTASVKVDDLVKRGDHIGTVGTTGWRRSPIGTTGFEHVHWELRTERGRVDPLSITEGCFDPKRAYPTERLVLTYPVRCKN
jgi:murein DD-endopeptidase MepM/ murein hydrolase activator NlpD